MEIVCTAARYSLLLIRRCRVYSLDILDGYEPAPIYFWAKVQLRSGAGEGGIGASFVDE